MGNPEDGGSVPPKDTRPLWLRAQQEDPKYNEAAAGWLKNQIAVDKARGSLVDPKAPSMPDTVKGESPWVTATDAKTLPGTSTGVENNIGKEVQKHEELKRVVAEADAASVDSARAKFRLLTGKAPRTTLSIALILAASFIAYYFFSRGASGVFFKEVLAKIF